MRWYHSRPSGVKPMRGRYWSLSGPVSLALPGGQVDDEKLHLGIGVPGLGILERKGLVVQLAVETHHLHRGHLALVETQVSYPAPVGRKGVGPCQPELLLVDPVRGAVDDGVPLAVGGQPPRLAGSHVVEIEVVAVGVENRRAVGRERRIARRLGVGQDRLQRLPVGKIVFRGVRMAVDRRAARSDEQAALVGRKGIVGNPRRERPGQQFLAVARLGIAVADHVVLLDDRIVFAVVHRPDAADAPVHGPQAGDFVVLAAGLRRTQRKEPQQQEDNFQLTRL